MRKARRQIGMTLVEILAVVVILGLIAATLLVGFSGTFGKAKHELAKVGIGVVADALEKYRIEHGAYPENDQGLSALTDGQATKTLPAGFRSDNGRVLAGPVMTRLPSYGTLDLQLELATDDPAQPKHDAARLTTKQDGRVWTVACWA